MNDYITDAFTRQNDKTNLDINNLNVDCITSRNNKFELDSEGNLTVKSITAEEGLPSSTSVNVLNDVYPVGSIYMSVLSTNPQTIFGGSWTQIKDRFLLACGDEYVNGATGGTATHTLSVSEMPQHSHKENYSNLYNVGGGVVLGSGNVCYANAGLNYYTENTGGGQPHNNMPPYLAVYIWKRTA